MSLKNMKTQRILTSTQGWIAALLVAFTTSAFAADAALPTPQEIVAKYIKAIGGKESLMKTSSMRAKGKFDIPAQKMGGEIEVLRAKPNHQLVKLKLNLPTGEPMVINTGFDGTNGWLSMPFPGPMLLEGKMLDQARDEADFYSQLHEESGYSKMQTVGTTIFGGKECYEVKFVRKSGRETTEYFDVRSGLQIGAKANQETPQGAVDVVTRQEDYQKFGDLQIPTRMTQKMGDVEQVITISSVTFEAIPDKDMEAPSEIKALLKSSAKH